jgi:hypothetical protein
MLYTATFTAVTVTGTIYGAGLKTQQEWQSVCFPPHSLIHPTHPPCPLLSRKEGRKGIRGMRI